ncbi:lipopolysaccharide transport system permease protein [Desulfonatronum zhilinae]|nr:lipopolysaccharide transport system permease protein [Desulfonatronum zhilinae]
MPHSSSPAAMLRGLWRNRQLIARMTKREIIGRYKGSALGLFWSILHPVFMLVVYTFVFSVVFKARWNTGDEETKTQFAIILFAGLIVHGLFTEMLNRAPWLVLANPNYVKKVIFPLEILPITALGSVLFHSIVSLTILLAAFLLFNGFLHWTVLLVPLVLLPLIILSLAFSWILASLGVFLRDVAQTTSIATMVLLFASPIFFPVSAIPENLRIWIMLNPLTFIIEQLRMVLVWGTPPNWPGLALYTLIALVAAWVGFAWFQKTRPGFADVL